MSIVNETREAPTAPSAPSPSPARRLSSVLDRKPKLRLGMLLSLPLLWLGLVYVVAILAVLLTAFWSVDNMTGELHRSFTFDNVHAVLTEQLYRSVTLRTLGIAIAVTAIDVVIALPIAFYMGKIAAPRTRRWLVIAVLTPLWASYLVKAFAWLSLLSGKGLLSQVLGWTPGYGVTAVILTQAYIWLPFVILPIYTGFERVPNSLLEASADLGGKTGRTLRSVVLPMMVPAIVAGSLFSFSLTLGDYITVRLVGGTKQMLGTLIYTDVGAANNLPLAAAVAIIPIVIMGIYLVVAKRTGALDRL
ncbi:ABC transporter permease [Flexivirga meconopsidis]|uniref:ABC transporter permease n=1 Tax=Flexivirga meconopsidis TaxID=2977121 RepID=UPI00223FA591|nr:ABC transporter permease [Flexivirga meconopsidis]